MISDSLCAVVRVHENHVRGGAATPLAIAEPYGTIRS